MKIVSGGHGPTRLDGLQALRGLSALAVFFGHALWQASVLSPPGPQELVSALSLGGLGVFVFFSISGFLVTSKANDAPINFAIDRIRRVYPLFWITLVVQIVVTWLVLGEPITHSFTVAMLVPEGHGELSWIPYWTLIYEVHFYALLFVLILLFGKRPKFIGWCVVAWGILSVVFHQRPFMFDRDASPTWLSIQFSMYGIFFAAGVLAGIGVKRSWKKAYFFGAISVFALGHVAIFFVLGKPLFFIQRLGEPIETVNLIWAFGAFCAVRASLHWPATGFVGRVLAKVGDVSYGLYLSHMIIIIAFVSLIKPYVHLHYGYSFALIVAVCLAPALGYGILDGLIQRTLKGIQKRRSVLVLGKKSVMAESNAEQATIGTSTN